MTSLAELGVGRQKHGLRRDHGDAGIERGLAQVAAAGRLPLSASCALVLMPRHVFLPDFDRDRVAARLRSRSRPRRSDRIPSWHCRRRCDRAATSACWPSSAISPPLQSVIARSFSLASLCSRMATSLSVLDQQTAVTGRIGGREIRAPRPRRLAASAARSRCKVSARISGVSANITRISSKPRASASAAPPAPHARCRAARICTRDLASGNQRAWLPSRPHRDRARSRPRRLARPRRATARSTCAKQRFVRRSWCSTFGSAERMRVPSPAASTTARHVLSAIIMSVPVRFGCGLSGAEPPPKSHPGIAGKPGVVRHFC